MANARLEQLIAELVDCAHNEIRERGNGAYYRQATDRRKDAEDNIRRLFCERTAAQQTGERE
jgi:hypothetical protein